MIEIRDFEGDSREAAEFTSRVWMEAYEGHHALVVWDERYYDWQLFGGRQRDRNLFVGAYDGGELVGTFFAEPFRFGVQGSEVEGSTLSWLSVDRRMKGKAVGRKLAAEMQLRHRERGLSFGLGFMIAGTAGPPFWTTLPDTITFGNIGYWVRILDAEAAAAWAARPGERLLARALGPLMESLRSVGPSANVRRYETNDLPACADLLRPLSEAAELGYRWSEIRLAHQLEYRQVPTTLLFEQAGRVRGLINYYVVELALRTRIRAAQVDLLACGDLTSSECSELLRTSLLHMKEEGAQIVLVPRMVGCPSAVLALNRFAPLPAEISIACAHADTTVPRTTFRRFHVHIR